MKNKDINEQVVVITGMHRSGTSFISNMFQAMNLDIGENLLGPSHGNLRGHFEDIDFTHFHEDVLNKRGLSWVVTETSVDLKLNTEELKRAKRLIQNRSMKKVWGWKDPRTSLFLKIWSELLGNKARYIFIFRHPVEVLYSLIRRQNIDVLFDLQNGINAWRIYNEAILSFYKKHRETSILVNVAALQEDAIKVFQLVEEKLGIDLDVADDHVLSIFNKTEFNTDINVQSAGKVLNSFFPGSSQLYAKLNREADVSFREIPHDIGSEINDGKLDALISKLKNKDFGEQYDRTKLLYLALNYINPEIILPVGGVLLNSLSKLNGTGEYDTMVNRPISDYVYSREIASETDAYTKTQYDRLGQLNLILKEQLLEQKEHIIHLTNTISETENTFNSNAFILEEKSKRLTILKQQLLEQKALIYQLQKEKDEAIQRDEQKLYKRVPRKFKTLFRILTHVFFSK